MNEFHTEDGSISKPLDLANIDLQLFRLNLLFREGRRAQCMALIDDLYALFDSPCNNVNV